MTKGIVYYSDCRLDEAIANAVMQTLSTIGLPLVSVTLLPLDFGLNIIPFKCSGCGIETWARAAAGAWWESHTHGKQEPLARGYLTMFKQILAGLEALDTDMAFLCEHDVAYHPSHFDVTPERDDLYYYNRNVWKVRASDGHALHYPCDQVSGLCANRELLIQHYRKRIARVEAHGFSLKMGHEPGTHRRPERVDDFGSAWWMSAMPNIDIRHDSNLSPSRWRKDQFRNQQFTEGWTESSSVPGWGVTEGRFSEFLADVSRGLVAA